MSNRFQKGKVRGIKLRDVAARAGVSVASASRVLNGRSSVRPDIVERVQAAAEELGYMPHGAARALASQRFYRIGAVVPTLENASFARGVEALQLRLAAAGYTLLLASSSYDPQRELEQVRALIAGGIDGLFLIGGRHEPELEALIDAAGIAVVHAWVVDGSPTRPCVGFDNRRCAHRLTEHLLDLGHTGIGVIAGLTRDNDRAAQRVAGIRAALEARGLELPQEHLMERPYMIFDGQLGMRALMALERRPTAVICGNDVLAFGALMEANAQGIKVPEEVSIAGFDNMDFAGFTDPPLTTMHIPTEEIGARAADHLLARFAGTPTLSIVEVNVQLIVRGSTAPPAKVQRMAPATQRPAL